MKTSKRFTVVMMIIAATVLSAALNAQPGRRMQQRDVCAVPDLTEEQQDQLTALRAKHQKVMFNLRSEMQLYRDKCKLLLSEDEVNEKELQENLNGNAEIHKQMLQQKAKHHTEVRKLLNDEQKLIYDEHLLKHRGFKEVHGRGRPMCFR